MGSLTLQLQQFYLILKCLFPDLGCPLSSRGSSKPFLPACTCCLGPFCPSSPHGSAEPALWPLNTLNFPCAGERLKNILPAQAGTGMPSSSHTSCCSSWRGWDPAFCRVPAHVPLTTSDITLIPSWKTILISCTSSREGDVEAGPDELCFRNC